MTIKIPIYLIIFNQHSLPSAMLKECQRFDNSFPVIIDNASTYEPAREWLRQCETAGVEVKHMSKNYGHKVMWSEEGREILRKYTQDDYFVLSDSDLDLSGIPGSDLMELLVSGFNNYEKHIDCVGLGIRLDDLSEQNKMLVSNYDQLKSYFYRDTFDGKFGYGSVDTTFAARKMSLGTESPSFKSLVTRNSYVCRHLPWYFTNANPPPEDFKHYLKTADRNVSTFAKRYFELYGDLV